MALFLITKGNVKKILILRRASANRKIVGAQHFAEAAKAAGAFNPNIDYASPMDGDGHGSHTAAIAAGNNGIPLRMHGYELEMQVEWLHVLGPNSPPTTTKTTFLNPFDATLLGAVKAGVFVAQAAGNGGMGLSPSTRPHKMYTLVSANDVLLDSSVSKYNPSDCQRPEVFNKKLVEGKILLCGYSFNFVVGTASIKKVVATVKHLGAAGFVLVVENVSPGTKFDPVPSAVPGILITDVSKSMVNETIAAGNNGIPLRMHGYEFGNASGMAPRARIAVYKALYRLFGGFVADVVAAIDQVELKLTSPNSPPTTTKTTFLNPFDATLLGAVKAGVFVAQAAGNGGPFPKTLVSYSPWIMTVAAAIDDRRYKNHLTLGNGKMLAGMGLSPSTRPHKMYTLVSANDVLLDSSVSKYNPSDCQRPEVFNKKLVEGKILLCGYSFNFVVGTASIKKVVATVKHLGAAGFVLVVENVSPGTKFDPVPSAVPGILITDVSKSMDLIDYYNVSTSRDWTGRVKSFNAQGSIGDGLAPVLHKSSPQVALFSARGPNTKDFSFQDADLLKPDILAPGYLIWAAWCPNGTDEANYVGEGFALISGTSMAAPHIAGIAALVKQKHPRWSPAAIKSALMTTSKVVDRAGRLLQAQHYSDTEAVTLVKATPFDYGSGHVNPSAALDPGLVFDAGYEDYVGFLCTTPGIDAHEIRNYTNTPCNYEMKHPSNFNAPSIAISHLVGTQTVTRRVKNVAEVEETYTITARMQPSIAIEVNPPAMTLRPGASRSFSVTLTVRSVSGVYSFGEVKLKGSRGHKVRIPVVALGHKR
ncbi:hypothetical protein HID58_024713 [Brassica napus]|uniref:Subtilisin-like protease SBT2.6 n=1 Tax=Brassica napus TaxID=3708 RepID=A0ABQ8CIY4_BRANA|nr:hypothetical protein HID58_024713 [Brassica napus]